MTIQEVYLTFTRKLNRLSTNHRQNVPYPVFVNVFNEAQVKWARELLKVEDGTDQILEDLQSLIAKPYKRKPMKTEDFYFIDLPEDYFHFKRSWSSATQGKCSHKLWNVLVESANLGNFLHDPSYSPSFEWEETIMTIEKDQIKVYYDDFIIDEIELVYYKEPVKIDIAGYINGEGEASTNIDPQFSDDSLYEIIDKAVMLSAGDAGDIDTLQIKARG